MHVAIIMDGNGRWAARRHLPRSVGHRAGAKAVDAIVTAAVRQQISTLTLYAFSAANWNRPTLEVSALFQLLRRYLLTQTQRCLEQSVRINVIGRRDRLSTELRQLIERSERATAQCSAMLLRIAVDYSAQHSLVETCRRLRSETNIDRTRFMETLALVDHVVDGVPDVDLLIRTGGEKRLSDFLLWECAYAELHFMDCLWPDFDPRAFEAALEEYSRRDRRFGGLTAAALPGATGRITGAQ
jgi:undecaprenyl diphosphate synthase